MNYFELFGIPVQLKVDTSLLGQEFFRLSRKYHPDFFIHEPEDIQVDMLEKSSMLNKAWKTFRDPDATIRYVLGLKGLIEEEEKYELPADFLMEMLDINEQLMDADNEEAKRALLPAIQELENSIYQPVKNIIEHYDDTAITETQLLQVKEYYYKKKYLDRVQEQLGGMA